MPSGTEGFTVLGATEVSSTGSVQLTGGDLTVETLNNGGLINISGGVLTVLGPGALNLCRHPPRRLFLPNAGTQRLFPQRLFQYLHS